MKSAAEYARHAASFAARAGAALGESDAPAPALAPALAPKKAAQLSARRAARLARIIRSEKRIIADGEAVDALRAAAVTAVLSARKDFENGAS